MSPSTAAAAYAARYNPTSAELLRRVPDIADGLAGRLHNLAASPDVGRLDDLIRDASGLVPMLMKIRAAMLREQQPEQADGGLPIA